MTVPLGGVRSGYEFSVNNKTFQSSCLEKKKGLRKKGNKTGARRRKRTVSERQMETERVEMERG